MLGLSRVVNKPVNAWVAQITRSVASGNYNVDRSNYQNQLTEMRRSWLDEFAKKRDLKAEQDKEAKRITIENKAIKIRERRNLSAIRQAEHKKWQEADQLRKKTYQAKNHIKFEQQAVKQAERYRRVANDLKHESASWITAADLTTRINADLFADVPTTTGIVTKYSDQWRYQCQSSEYQLQQALYPKRFVTTKTPKELEEHMQAEQKFRHRQSVEEFLSGMVGSGEELLKLKDLVDDMVGDTIENKGGLLDEWKYCQQLYDQADEMVLDIMKYQAGLEYDEKTDTVRGENPALDDFLPPPPTAEEDGRDELWEYQGQRHSVVSHPEDEDMRDVLSVRGSGHGLAFEKRDAALHARQTSYVHDKKTYKVTDADKAEYEVRGKLTAKFGALAAQEDSFTWRGTKHVFTEEEKAEYVQIEKEMHMQAKAEAILDGETKYKFGGKVHDIDPAEIQEAHDLLAAKTAALTAGEESFTYQGRTVQLTEEEQMEFAEIADFQARLSALAEGADSYTFRDEVHAFSEEEKEEFAEGLKWVEARMTQLETTYAEELALRVEDELMTAAEAEAELEEMVAGRAAQRLELLMELRERGEEYLDRKWLEEFAEGN